MLKIGILALQGAFLEHEQMLDRLGVAHFQIRQLADLSQPMDGLIIPGGESTAIGKLMNNLRDCFELIKEKCYGHYKTDIISIFQMLSKHETLGLYCRCRRHPFMVSVPKPYVLRPKTVRFSNQKHTVLGRRT